MRLLGATHPDGGVHVLEGWSQRAEGAPFKPKWQFGQMLLT